MKLVYFPLGLSLFGIALAEVPTVPNKVTSMNKRGLPRRPATSGITKNTKALISEASSSNLLSSQAGPSIATMARGGGGQMQVLSSGKNIINSFLFAMVCGTTWAYVKVCLICCSFITTYGVSFQAHASNECHVGISCAWRMPT